MSNAKGFAEIPINKLVKASWNYKNENDFLAKKLIENIRRNGQIENIIVRELDDDKFEIVNGNHRLDAFISLGLETIHCFNLGKVSLENAQRIAIETNETKFETDSIRLSILLKDIIEEFSFEDVNLTMPFTENELSDMTDFADYVTKEIEDSDIEILPEKEKESLPLECPKCGYVFEKENKK